MTTGRLRVLRCEMGFISRADGSCSFQAGKSVVWAAVNGPGDSHPAKRQADRMAVDCSYRPSSGDAHLVIFDSLLRCALEHTLYTKLFPRAAAQVTVHELQSCGGMCALALTAAGMAALDAALPMKAPFCGVQVVRVPGTGLVVDPDEQAEQKADASFIFAFSTSPQTVDSIAPSPIVVGSHCTGPFSVEELLLARNLATEAAREIFAFFKECLQRKYTVETIA